MTDNVIGTLMLYGIGVAFGLFASWQWAEAELYLFRDDDKRRYARAVVAVFIWPVTVVALLVWAVVWVLRWAQLGDLARLHRKRD